MRNQKVNFFPNNGKICKVLPIRWNMLFTVQHFKSLLSVNAGSASIHTSNSSSASICSCSIGILFSSFSGAIVLITPSALQEGIQIRSHGILSLSPPKLIYYLNLNLTHFKLLEYCLILLPPSISQELAWKALHPATTPDSRWRRVFMSVMNARDWSFCGKKTQSLNNLTRNIIAEGLRVFVH